MRKNAGSSFTLQDFGTQIKKDYKDSQEKWLLGLCEKLQKEKFLGFEIKEGEIMLWLWYVNSPE